MIDMYLVAIAELGMLLMLVGDSIHCFQMFYFGISVFGLSMGYIASVTILRVIDFFKVKENKNE